MSTRTCPLCDRECPESIIQRHHLKTRRKDRHDIEKICRECHRTIHGLFSIKELRDSSQSLDTVEGLLSNPEFSKALSFIRKLPPGQGIRMRKSKRRGR